MDCLERWWEARKAHVAHVTTLVLNLDNGPESHSHRTRFIARLVAFVQRHWVGVHLAYDPPYQGKYNPIERCVTVISGSRSSMKASGWRNAAWSTSRTWITARPPSRTRRPSPPSEETLARPTLIPQRALALLHAT